MNSKTIQHAATRTIEVLARDYPDVRAKEIAIHDNPRYMQRRCIIADALHALQQIPDMIGAGKIEAALYGLGAAHSALWCAGAMTKAEIEAINREAVAIV